jgi:single-stranded-DNA-specific exonuclease
MPPQARSVKGFDVYNALEACSQHLEQFMDTCMPRNDFERRNYSCSKKPLKTETIHPDLLLPEIDIDAEINLQILPKLTDIKTVFGPLNMTPVFLTKT